MYDEQIDQNQNTVNTNPHDWLTPSADWERNNASQEAVSFRRRLVTWVSHNIGLTMLLLSIFILVEILWGISVVKKVSQKRTASATNAAANQKTLSLLEPSFSLSVASLEVNVKQELKVAIQIDTANQNTDGATVVLQYDPKLLQSVRFENGTVFKEYLKMKVDEKLGKLTVSGIPELSGFYNGKGTFGHAVFTAKAKGTTQIDFVHTANATDETTIAAQGKEILSSVQGVEVTIK